MKKLMPPTYLYTLILLAIATHFTIPLIKIIYFPYNLTGMIFIFFGATITLWADQIFKKEKTTVKPGEKSNKLIIKGPYKISRHPMYLGMLSILFGTSILLGSLVTFILPLIFIILIETKFVPLEERNMEKTFGKEYTNYKKKVRRWI